MAKFKSCLCPLCKHVTKKYSLLGYKVRYLINIINSGDQQIFIYSLYHLKNIKSGGFFLIIFFPFHGFFLSALTSKVTSFKESYSHQTCLSNSSLIYCFDCMTRVFQFITYIRIINFTSIESKSWGSFQFFYPLPRPLVLSSFACRILS